MVILNSPIVSSMIAPRTGSTKNPIFEQLWNQSSFHICADGGANRLYEYSQQQQRQQRQQQQRQNQQQDTPAAAPLFLPQLITGDLDSLQPHVRQYYEQHQVPIVRKEDQNYNDLDKSLKALLELNTNNPKKTNIINAHFQACFIYGAFGGRFDQEMASLQALFVHSHAFPKGLWLCDHANVAVLLQPNQLHVFDLQTPRPCPQEGKQQESSSSTTNDDLVVRLGPTCGLIPIGAPCPSVTTTGLQWNLDQDALAFGGLVSSSNCIVEEAVTIRTLHEPLLFSMEITTTSSSTTAADNEGV